MPTVAVVLIVLAAIHILEEAVKGFRGFFNTEWFNGNADCPVGRAKGLFVDQIGLFLVLAVLAWLGDRWIIIAVGILAADVAQHALFSFAKKRYTPGVATSVLYLGYVIYIFAAGGVRLTGLDWLALAAGGTFIAGNYLLASWKVRSGQCEPTGA